MTPACHTVPPVAATPAILDLLKADAPVAIGVSGGKDSQAAALATFAYLDEIGHTGPRVLIHSDLGSVEWTASLPVCERLAAHLGVELMVVRRAAGDLMQRWEARWQSSLHRYIELSTVTLVLPWSTPALRFCTSELKTHIIGAALRRRFKGQTVVNVTGVRREESAARAKGSIASKDADGKAWSWRPISDWTEAEVFAYIAARGVETHEAYREFGMSRVSCRFCIMSNIGDLTAAAAVPESHDLYRRMVSLEIASTFAFQGSRWLGDVAPHLLTEDQRAGLAVAKLRSVARIAAEKQITRGMLYVKGWPTRMLTDDEADLLADVRQTVGNIIEIRPKCINRVSVHARYAELMAANAQRLAA
jgi:3'-phosphoadenosine 5'-phosphosulfate sulfotransferase (PAPS reductase)/FAD synthetase